MEESRHEMATRHVDGVENFTIWLARLLSCPPMNASQLSRGGRAREMWWKPWMASVWLPAPKAAYLVGVASGISCVTTCDAHFAGKRTLPP